MKTGAEAATTFWANAFCEASSFSAKPNEFETSSSDVGRSWRWAFGPP